MRYLSAAHPLGMSAEVADSVSCDTFSVAGICPLPGGKKNSAHFIHETGELSSGNRFLLLPGVYLNSK